MVELIFLSLDVDGTKRDTCESAVHRFAQFVADPPLGITCKVLSIDRELESLLLSACDEPDIANVTAIMCDHLEDSPPWNEYPVRIPKVVIACDGSSQLTQKVRKSNPHAKWGGSNGCLSIVYQHDPVVIWHEIFHLLGADDCYEVSATGSIEDRKCGNENCIMQYAPIVEDVGNPPFICDANIQIMREQWKA